MRYEDMVMYAAFGVGGIGVVLLIAGCLAYAATTAVSTTTDKLEAVALWLLMGGVAFLLVSCGIVSLGLIFIAAVFG